MSRRLCFALVSVGLVACGDPFEPFENLDLGDPSASSSSSGSTSGAVQDAGNGGLHDAGSSSSSSGGSSSGQLPPGDDAGPGDAGPDDGGVRPPPSAADDVTLVPATLPAPGCSGRFCWEHPAPSGNDYWAAAGFDDGTAIAGGATDLVTFDGTAWQRETLPEAFAVESVAGTSLQDVWAMGNACEASHAVFFHRVGAAWTRVVTPLACTNYVASSYDGATLWVGSDAGISRLDGGAWTSWAGLAPRSLWSGGGVRYAAAWDHGLARFDGTSWVDVTSELASAIDLGAPLRVSQVTGTAADDVWIVTSAGVLRYDGTTWSKAFTGGTIPYQNEYDTVAVRWRGEAVVSASDLYRLSDGTSTKLDVPEVFFGGVVAARGAVLAYGQAGSLVRLNGLGSVRDTQRLLKAPTEASSVQSSTEAYVVGTNQLAVRSAAGWSAPIALPQAYAGSPASDVWGASPNAVFVALYGGHLMHYDGAAWTAFEAPPTPSYAALRVAGSSASRVVVASPSAVHRWNGTTWSADASVPAFGGYVGDVAVTDTEVLVTGDTGLYVESGGTWNLAPGTAGKAYSALAVRGSDVFAAGEDGVAYRHAGAWTVADGFADFDTYAASIAPDGGLFVVAGGGSNPALHQYVPNVGWSTVLYLDGMVPSGLFVDTAQLGIATTSGFLHATR